MPFPPEAFLGGYPPQLPPPDAAEFPGMPFPPYGAMPFPGMMPEIEELPETPGEQKFLKEDDETDFQLDDAENGTKRGRGNRIPRPVGMNALPPGARPGPEGTDRAHMALDLPWYFEFIAVVITALAISSLIRLFLLQPFYIPSQSMEKTLMN